MSRKREAIFMGIGILTGLALCGPASAAVQLLTAAPTSQTFYVDGQRVQFEAYEIHGNNFIKLRDIGKAVDFFFPLFQFLWQQGQALVSDWRKGQQNFWRVRPLSVVFRPCAWRGPHRKWGCRQAASQRDNSFSLVNILHQAGVGCVPQPQDVPNGFTAKPGHR